MSSRALPLLVLLATVPVAFAQSGPSPISERVEVKVINVDVTVTDSHGQPVTGLTKDDFEVFEDGRPQKISNFDAIARTTTVQTPAAPSTTPAPVVVEPAHVSRRIVLLVDNNYIDKIQRDAALRKIDAFVDRSGGADTEWAVATISQRVEMLQPFTSDTALVHKALSTARTLPTFSQRSDIDRAILSDSTRRNERASNQDEIGAAISAKNYKTAVRFQAREQTWRALRTVSNTARAVAETARSYSAVEGRKVMVLVTGGMETNTTFSAYDTGFDREIQQTRLEIAETIDSMVREANSANFTVDVLNARTRGFSAPQHDTSNHSAGLGPNLWRTGGGNEPVDTTDIDSSSLTIAEGTGGEYLTSNRINESLDRLDTQTSVYYSLGYTPTAHDDYAYHRISVKVKRPGVRVVHRQGYVDLSPEDRLEQVLRARLAVDQPPGTVPVALEVGKSRTRDDRYSVPVTAAVPLEKLTLVPIDGTYSGRIHVYVSVFDSHGNNIGFSHKVQEVRLSEQEFNHAGDFRYTVKVRLGKGAFKVLVTVRDDLSNELGSAVEAVQV